MSLAIDVAIIPLNMEGIEVVILRFKCRLVDQIPEFGVVVGVLAGLSLSC
jgi:hypothetical protein